jgi:hypothetical protein
MPNTIDVTIPAEPEAAAALQDARNRETIGRLLQPRPGRRQGVVACAHARR